MSCHKKRYHMYFFNSKAKYTLLFIYLIYIQQEPDCGVTLSLHPHIPSCHYLNGFFQTVWDSVQLFLQKFLSDCIPHKKVKKKTAFFVNRKKKKSPIIGTFCFEFLIISVELMSWGCLQSEGEACCFTCIAVLLTGGEKRY